MRLFRDDLEDVELFAEASRSERVLIRRHLTPLSVSAGRVLVEEGARGDEFMVLVQGNATVTASTNAEIYVGSRADFRQIMQAVPSVARKVQQTAAARTLARAA